MKGMIVIVVCLMLTACIRDVVEYEQVIVTQPYSYFPWDTPIDVTDTRIYVGNSY